MPVVSAFLGSTIIYSGANIGDGPGWYCVFVAGAMGMVSWFFLGWIINILSGTFEKITVERNINTGILFGFYLFASAIILARASAGDWTSFYDTILEFGAGYPVLFLAAFHIILEKMINRNNDPYYNNENSDKIRLYPILIGIFYIVYAVIAVLLSLPMKENPIYEQIMLLF